MAAACCGTWSCSDDFDDSSIWEEIDRIKTDLETLEQQVSSLQTALGNGALITEVTPTTDGYEIRFSDGSKITVKNGRDGATGPDGEDAAQIGVREEDGTLYWTLGGEFITAPGTDEKIPVTGADGRTPALGIDDEGYWTVDGERIAGTDGLPVKAEGDSFFSKVEDTADAVIFTLADGSTIVIDKLVASSLFFTTSDPAFAPEGTTATLTYEAEEVEFVEIFSIPEGWNASIDEAASTVMVSATAGTAANGERLKIVAADRSGHLLMAAARLYHTLPQGGFYVYNEGQFGKTPASLNYRCDGMWFSRVYAAVNPDRPLGNTGTVWVRNAANGMTYFTAKDTHFLVETDAALQYRSELGSQYKSIFGQMMSFAAFDAATGYVTAQNGVFRVNLDPLELGDRIFEGRNGGADLCVENGKLYFIFSDRVYVYDPTAGQAPRQIAAASTGFVRTNDGMLWAAGASQLVRIAPQDDSVKAIPSEDYEIYYNSMAYTPCSIAASPNGESIYFLAKKGSGFSSAGKALGKYDTASGQFSELWALPDGYSVYGSGIRVDPESGDIYVTYTKDGWGANYLKTYIAILTPDGAVEETVPYLSEQETVYWFPSHIAF